MHCKVLYKPLSSYLLNSIFLYCPNWPCALSSPTQTLFPIYTSFQLLLLLFHFHPPSYTPSHLLECSPNDPSLGRFPTLQADSVSLSFVLPHTWFYFYGHSFAMTFQTWQFICVHLLCSCDLLKGWD